MVTTDKVNVGESSTRTSTSTTWHCPYTQPKAEQGWECPRCGRINAPWVRQCDCTRNNWDITWKDTTTDDDEWWKKYVTTCTADTFKVHPDGTVYTTARNPVVGGGDYKDSVTGTWVNVPKTYTNSVKG